MIKSIQEAKCYAEKSGLIFMEVSTATGKNVEDLFTTVGEFNNSTICSLSEIVSKYNL